MMGAESPPGSHRKHRKYPIIDPPAKTAHSTGSVGMEPPANAMSKTGNWSPPVAPKDRPKVGKWSPDPPRRRK